MDEQFFILECATEAAANEIINLWENLNYWESKDSGGESIQVLAALSGAESTIHRQA